MRVFLTGGTGFIGSHVAEQLLNEGCEVVALVRETSDTSYLDELELETVVGALGRAGELESALTDVDAVIHVAGMTGSPDAEVLYRVNAEGTRDLADTVARVADEGTRFIYVSSVSAQGPSQGCEPRSPDRIPEPVSFYGKSKLEGEGASLAHRDSLRVTIIRPPAVYGPRDWDMFEVFQLANRRVTPVLGGQKRWLSLIHGEDVASAVIACLDAPGEGEIYTVDDGKKYTWQQLGKEISAAVGKRALPLPLPKWVLGGAATFAEVGGGLLNMTATFNRDKYREMIQPSWVCGHEAIHRDLGWEPKWTLEEGARQTAQWYRDHGWL